MNEDCNHNCCGDFQGLDDYDEIIEQLKETRNSIDRMIKTLKQRKMKDNVINDILNTEYEEEIKKEKESKEKIEELLKELGYIKPKYYKNYTTTYKYPPHKNYYPHYFKF